VIPGVYSVRVRVTRTATIPDGSAQTLALASNASPFTIGPRVSGTVVNPGGDGHVTGRLFQHADLPPDQVELCVGSTALRRVNAVPAAGEFFVASPTQLDFQLPAALPSGDARLRVFVGGAESPPRWIQVP